MRFGRWALRQDRYNWILERHEKTGKPEQTYHRDLPQVANWIMNWEAKHAVGGSEGSEGPEWAGDLKALTATLSEREAHLAAILEEAHKVSDDLPRQSRVLERVMEGGAS